MNNILQHYALTPYGMQPAHSTMSMLYSFGSQPPMGVYNLHHGVEQHQNVVTDTEKSMEDSGANTSGFHSFTSVTNSDESGLSSQSPLGQHHGYQNLNALKQEPNIQQPIAHVLPNIYEPYCTVPGRLTLLSNTKKYRVTLGEIQRRISPPECLNASILGGILRKAKNKDGGKVLRDGLAKNGIILPSGRRKSAPTTTFTSLAEEEALQMARDFDEISKAHYPLKAASKYMLRNMDTAAEAYQRRLELFYTKRFLSRLAEFHNADCSPLTDQRVDPTLEPEMQKALTNYSLLTHGFGGLAMRAVLDALTNCSDECLQAIDREYPMSNEIATSLGFQQTSSS
ncbi:transcription factor AP-2 domain-containing protein [Ditylenchus destructor]|nr:transcription factor AP-2 domain-containing protein [Ditylenchus destructor]